MFKVLVDDTFAGSPRSWLAETDYRLARSVDELWDYARDGLRRKLDPSQDFETTGLNIWTDKIVGYSLSFERGKGIYAPVRHFAGEDLNLSLPKVMEVLDEIDRCQDVTSWWFNGGGFDHPLAWHDVGWRPRGRWRDGMLAAWLEYSDAPSHGLKESAMRLLGLEMIDYKEIVGFKQKKGLPIPGFQFVHPEPAVPYACADADLCGRIARLQTVLEGIRNQSLIWDLEHKILRPIEDGIEHGIPCDGVYLELLGRHVQGELRTLEAEIKTTLGVPTEFNLRSRLQLGHKVEALGVPVEVRNQNGAMSTKKTLLAKHAAKFPVCAQLVKYAELGAAENNYRKKLAAGVAHFGPVIRLPFNQTGAPTGRMSSGGAGRTATEAFRKGYVNVNGQSMPDPEKQAYLPDIRAAITVAALNTDEWVVVAADYNQVELRVLGNVSGEPEWERIFKADIDIHRGNWALAKGIPVEQVDGKHRKKGKTLSFAIVYQSSPAGVARQAELATEQEAKDLIRAYLGRCQRIDRWIRATKAFAHSHGWVQTFCGRRRVLKGYFGGDYSTKAARTLRNQGLREAVNAPIQGGAADVFKIAIWKVYKALHEWGAQDDWVPIMWVHDELVSLVRRRRLYELLPQVQRVMQFEVKGWKIPLKVDFEVGWNWGKGLIPWVRSKPEHTTSWLELFPPETAETPLVCWLPASVYDKAPAMQDGIPEPTDPDESSVEDDLADLFVEDEEPPL